MISMGDVARQAGVAKSTVSRILSGNGSFCPETCTKVFDACEKLNYKLNPNIQDLVLKGRGGATRNIAVLMVEATFANPAYSYWIDALGGEISSRHYHLMLVKLSGTESSVYEFPSVLRDERVDGIFITGMLTLPLMKEVRRLNLPVIVIGNYDPSLLSGCGNITTDPENYLRRILTQFKARGVRRLAYVDEGQDSFFENELFAAYRKLLPEFGMTFSPDRCYFGKGRATGMFDLMLPVFATSEIPFDGVFCPDMRIAREIHTLCCMRRGFEKRHPMLPLGTIQKPETPILPEDTIFGDIHYGDFAAQALDDMIAIIAAHNQKTGETSGKQKSKKGGPR